MTSLFSKKVIKETLFQFYLYDTTDQLMLQPAVTIVSLFLLFVSQRICKDHVTVLNISKYQVADPKERRYQGLFQLVSSLHQVAKVLELGSRETPK